MTQPGSVVEVIRQIFIEQFEVEPERLTPDARLREDLDIDSLDAAELLIALEKHLGVRIEEERARKMKTVADIQEYAQESCQIPYAVS